MVLRFHGIDADPDEVTRALAFYRDGASLVDLQELLTRRGHHSLIFSSGTATVPGLLRAGAPAIIFEMNGRRKHALVAVGYTAEREGDQCTGKLVSLEVIDPRTGKGRTLTRQALDERFGPGQVMVVLPGGDRVWRGKLEAQGVDVGAAAAANARHRAEEWLLRARKHEVPNPQALELLERACREDPCWAVPLEELKSAYRQSGQPEKARELVSPDGCVSPRP